MNYTKEGKKPPKSKRLLSTPKDMIKRLQPLLGQKIVMTGDGANFRKLITKQMLAKYMPKAASDYDIIPPKKKGVPTFLREYIDTYIVTTGEIYNLQVWNRNPNSASVQVDLKNGETLLASDIRFVLGKINANSCIESIVIMTPDYIELSINGKGHQSRSNFKKCITLWDMLMYSSSAKQKITSLLENQTDDVEEN